MWRSSSSSYGNIVLLVALLCCFRSIVAPPVILNYPPTALPGEILNLYGVFPRESRVFLSSEIRTDETELKTILAQDNFLAVLVPGDVPLDVFTLWIQDSSGSSSEKVAVNLPVDLTTDTLGDIVIGSTIRVYGRNLYFGGDSQPSLALADDSGNVTISFDLNLNQSDQHVLVATVPQGVITEETDYQLVVQNGLVSCPAVMMDNPLTGRLSGDVFDVGVGFVSDVRISTRIELTPSGSDDTAAIRSAIQNASAVGGLVVLSAGAFQLRDCAGLEMLPNVVIQGAGMDVTELRVGYCPNATQSSLWASRRLLRFGLLDLTIADQLSDVSMPSIDAQSASDLFLHRVRIRAPELSFSRLSRAVLSDSELIQVGDATGSFEFACSSSFLIRNCTIALQGGNVLLDRASNLIVSDCVIQRDFTVASSSTKILSLSQSNHVILYNNNISSLNFDFGSAAQLLANNFYGDVDGAVVAEDADSFIEADWGTVQRASGSDLVDRTYYWSPFITSLYAAIVYGNGLGQVREVISNTETTVVMRESWAVVPDAARSRYALTPLVAANWIMKKNSVKNHVRSVVLSGGGMWNLLLADNSFEDSGGVFIQPHQIQRSSAVPRVITEAEGICDGAATQNASVEQQRLFGFAFGVDVLGNTVKSSRAEIPAQISFSPRQIDEVTNHGTAFLGVRVRRNNISMSATSDAVGYVNSACIKLAGSQQPNADNYVPLLLGSVFQNNAVSNAPAALLVGPVADFTLAVCMTAESVKLPSQLQSTSLCPSYGLQARNTATRFGALCATDPSKWEFAKAALPKKKGTQLSLAVSIVIIVSVALGILVMVAVCYGLHEWREDSAETRRAKKRARKQYEREAGAKSSGSLTTLLANTPLHRRYSSDLGSATSSSPRSSLDRSSTPTTTTSKSLEP